MSEVQRFKCNGIKGCDVQREEDSVLVRAADYDALRAENKRLRNGIERLASPLAFDMSRACTTEETFRMKFAQAVLDEPAPQTAVSPQDDYDAKAHSEMYP